MPVRNRKYENLLQFIFGGLIFLALLQLVAKLVIRLVHSWLF
jgi:hypothetical protein